MDKFRPITNNTQLELAIEYVAEKSLALARLVLGRDMDLDTICFFTQTPQEYDFLRQAVLARGNESKLSHGPTLYVDSNFDVFGHTIRIFGVRQPDPENRPEVGYGDYPVADFSKLAKANTGNPHVKPIVSGLGKPLLELCHENYDVLGYVVPEDHGQAN